MDKKNLKILLDGALGHKVPAEFAAENYDYNTALRDEIKKFAGTMPEYQKNKWDIFELLAQELYEELPQRITAALDLFCEFITVNQGDRLEFRVRKGKQRGKQFVTRATESGSYESFRLDHERFDIYPVALAGAGRIDFERMLDGLEDIADSYEVIREGFLDRIFEMIQGALLESWKMAGRPARNKVAVNGFDIQSMRELVNTVTPYGAPIIYCTPEFAAEMVNAITYDTTVKITDQDAMEIRERGYIGKFFGTPVVVMPQSFTDENNEKLAMNPSFAYVIPSGKEKLVKVGMEGQPYFREWENRDNSIELQGYVKIGVGIVNRPNYWGIYYNAALDAGGWTEYNKTIVSSEEVKG